MKFAKKYVILPYEASSPIKQYISNLDKDMNNILNSEMPDDQKLKHYSSLLSKYKKNYNIDKANMEKNEEIDLLNEIKEENKNVSNLLNEVKDNAKNTENIANEKKHQFDETINKKYNQLNYSLKKLEKKLKANIDDSVIADKSKRVILKAKKVKRKPETADLAHYKKHRQSHSIIEENMDTSNVNYDDELNIGFSNVKPMQTRSERKEYDMLKEKARLSSQQEGSGYKWTKIKYF